jgi:ATP-dependent Lon protease
MAPPQSSRASTLQVVGKKRTRKVPVYHGEPIVIDEAALHTYLGKEPFDLDKFYAKTPVGVVMGLAWTSMGGSTLYIESNRVSALNPNAEPSMTVTGAAAHTRRGGSACRGPS